MLELKPFHIRACEKFDHQLIIYEIGRMLLTDLSRQQTIS